MSKKVRTWLIVLIFFNGFISLSLELVILRQLSFWVGSSPVITSIIMGAFLGFMSLGYWLGNSPRVRIKYIPKTLCASFLFIAALALFAASFPLVAKYFSLMYNVGITSGVVQTFIYSFVFLSVGPFLFGFNTTLLSRLLQVRNKNNTGNIMAVDTIGSVIASMVTTLIMMPFLGVNYTVGLVILFGCMCALLSYHSLWVWIVSAVLLVFGGYINSDYIQYSKYGILVNNSNSTISVAEFEGVRVLDMNRLAMSMYDTRNGSGASYINFVNDNFIYTLPADKPHKILILGAGGFTVGLRDTFNEYTFVDIEPTLKDISEKYFLKQKLSSNKKFIVQDASQFLKNTTQQYDIILLDVYSNSFQVPEGLITTEFMSRIKSRVAPNGVVLMNIIESPSFGDAYTRVFDNTFHSVFTHNTSRQIIDTINPWVRDEVANVMYIYFNVENDGRIYTINKTPVIYDR